MKTMSDNMKFDTEMSMLVDALMEDDFYEEPMIGAASSNKTSDLKDMLDASAKASDWHKPSLKMMIKPLPNSSTIHWGLTSR